MKKIYHIFAVMGFMTLVFLNSCSKSNNDIVSVIEGNYSGMFLLGGGSGKLDAKITRTNSTTVQIEFITDWLFQSQSRYKPTSKVFQLITTKGISTTTDINMDKKIFEVLDVSDNKKKMRNIQISGFFESTNSVLNLSFSIEGDNSTGDFGSLYSSNYVKQ